MLKQIKHLNVLVSEADNLVMGMVDRYKKSGGFVQLLQVIETCGAKKREQFMGIITQESPAWADALIQKGLTYEKILSWKPEILLEVVASVNMLSFATSLKSLSTEQLAAFLGKFSHQDKGKFEKSLLELNPSAPEISSSQMKVISETRGLLTTGALKADKIDQQLVIPHDFEATLQKGGSKSISGASPEVLSSASPTAAPSIDDVVTAALNHNAAGAMVEVDKLQKKLALVAKEVQVLKQENLLLKDKLDKIRKIA